MRYTTGSVRGAPVGRGRVPIEGRPGVVGTADGPWAGLVPRRLPTRFRAPLRCSGTVCPGSRPVPRGASRGLGRARPSAVGLSAVGLSAVGLSAVGLSAVGLSAVCGSRLHGSRPGGFRRRRPRLG
ncbi:hypothetical protein ThrDRAFT_01732 [Frankia casuarinae]|nr:hypothetical protein ThrDRAFT_01732 [Frankia casuarinae]